MSVTTEGDPDGDWTSEDPEASLDLLAIRSLRMRNSEDDISLGQVPLFPNDKDLEAFVRDFAIDDAISDCFADLPPSSNDSLRTSSFIPLASQPEKKLVSPRVKASPSSPWKPGSVATPQPPPVSDPPVITSESAGSKSRGFLASLLARGVRGFKAEGRNKKLPANPHPPPQLQGNASGKDPPSPRGSGVSLAEDGKESAFRNSSASRDPVLHGETENLFEDVSLAHRDESVSGIRGSGHSEQSLRGGKRDAQPSGIHESSSLAGKHVAERGTTVGKQRSHVQDTAAGKLPPVSNHAFRKHSITTDKSARQSHVSQNGEAHSAALGKRQTQFISAGNRAPGTENTVKKHVAQSNEANRSTAGEKNCKPAADTQKEPLERQQQQAEAASTKTKESPLPGTRRGPWEGLIQGIDSFIDFERDPSLEIPLNSHLSSQFDFERDSSLELESVDSHLASQFEFDMEQGREGVAQVSPLPSQDDSERADIHLPHNSSHLPEGDADNVSGASGIQEEAGEEDTDQLYVRLKAEGLPPSGKTSAASTDALSSHTVCAPRGQSVRVKAGSMAESAGKDDASECSMTSSDMASKAAGPVLTSSQRISESTQTEDYRSEAESKGRAANYIQIAIAQLSNLSSYSACTEVVARTMSHLQRALLELNGDGQSSDDYDPAVPYKDLTTSSLAAFIGSKNDGNNTPDSRFPVNDSHVLYAGNITKDSHCPFADDNPIDAAQFADSMGPKKKASSHKAEGAVELTSAESLPVVEKAAGPSDVQDGGNFPDDHTKERRIAAASPPLRRGHNPTDPDCDPHVSRDAVPMRPYDLPSSSFNTTTAISTITVSTTATSLKRQLDLDTAMTSSPTTSRDTESSDSTSTVTSEPNTVKTARSQRETTLTTTKRKKPIKQKNESCVSTPLNEESPPQIGISRPTAGWEGVDRDEPSTQAKPAAEVETPMKSATGATVMTSISWDASKDHPHDVRSSRSSCGSRRRHETTDTTSYSSANRRRREKSCSVSSIDTMGYKTNNPSGAPPFAGATVDVEGGGAGDCESFLTSSWSEMTSVSSVCDVITSADESSYYSGDDDDDDDDEDEEEGDNVAAVVRLGLQDEDQDESELRHHRLQRHLAAVLRQASTPTVTIETVVAATGERLNSQERHFSHVNQGALYPFSPSGPSSAYEATPTDGSAPPFSASEGGDRAGVNHGSEKVASIRPSKAFASNMASKKGGATPRLFSPERQVSQIEARQMTSDQFRESYDRSSDIAKVKRSQLDGDVPWDLLQFSDTDDDAASEHAWYDVTSEEESAAHAYSTDTDSSAAASDW